MNALTKLVQSHGGIVAFSLTVGYSHAYVSRVLSGGTPSFAFCQAVRSVYGVILDPGEWPDARRKSPAAAGDDVTDSPGEAA